MESHHVSPRRSDEQAATSDEQAATRVPGLWIGTSGYEYDEWRGVLYPTDLPRGRWLDHYASRFRTVELNSTFYGLPKAAAVRRWRETVPSGFRFAVKLSRYGTHLKRLKDPQGWLRRFLEAVSPLGSALGPILVQLPPRWHRDVPRLAGFLEAAPPGQRLSLEVRDPDWLDGSVYSVLREHDVALCIHDRIEDHPQVVTAGWIYLRFHGPNIAAPYTGAYSPKALSDAARRMRGHLDAGRDVYAYFDNDVAGHAVHDALALRGLLNDR